MCYPLHDKSILVWLGNIGQEPLLILSITSSDVSQPVYILQQVCAPPAVTMSGGTATEDLVLGVDVGTGSARAAVFSTAKVRLSQANHAL